MTDSGRQYYFRENGDVEISTDGEVDDVRNWWYEEPADPFEDA